MQVDTLISLLVDDVGVTGPVLPDTPLLTSGRIDSFDVPVLVSTLEDAIGCELPLELVGAHNFDTPAQMAAAISGLAG